MNIGILDSKDAKYPMQPMEDFDSDDIKDFINNYKKGIVYHVKTSFDSP